MDVASARDRLDGALRVVERLPLPGRAWRMDVEPWRVLVRADDEARATLEHAPAPQGVSP